MLRKSHQTKNKVKAIDWKDNLRHNAIDAIDIPVENVAAMEFLFDDIHSSSKIIEDILCHGEESVSYEREYSLDNLIAESNMFNRSSTVTSAESHQKGQFGEKSNRKVMSYSEFIGTLIRNFPCKLLVNGPDGSGKSELFRALADAWSKDKLWKDKFDYVFILPLRYLSDPAWILKYKASMQLDKYENDEKSLNLKSFLHFCVSILDPSIDLAKLMHNFDRKPGKFLFLVDGLDDVLEILTNKTHFGFKKATTENSMSTEYYMIESILEKIFSHDHIVANTRTISGVCYSFHLYVNIIPMSYSSLRKNRFLQFSTSDSSQMDSCNILGFYTNSHLSLSSIFLKSYKMFNILQTIWKYESIQNLLLTYQYLNNDIFIHRVFLLHIVTEFLKHVNPSLSFDRLAEIPFEILFQSPLLLFLEELAFKVTCVYRTNELEVTSEKEKVLLDNVRNAVKMTVHSEMIVALLHKYNVLDTSISTDSSSSAGGLFHIIPLEDNNEQMNTNEALKLLFNLGIFSMKSSGTLANIQFEPGEVYYFYSESIREMLVASYIKRTLTALSIRAEEMMKVEAANAKDKKALRKKSPTETMSKDSQILLDTVMEVISEAVDYISDLNVAGELKDGRLFMLQCLSAMLSNDEYSLKSISESEISKFIIFQPEDMPSSSSSLAMGVSSPQSVAIQYFWNAVTIFMEREEKSGNEEEGIIVMNDVNSRILLTLLGGHMIDNRFLDYRIPKYVLDYLHRYFRRIDESQLKHTNGIQNLLQQVILKEFYALVRTEFMPNCVLSYFSSVLSSLSSEGSGSVFLCNEIYHSIGRVPYIYKYCDESLGLKIIDNLRRNAIMNEYFSATNNNSPELYALTKSKTRLDDYTQINLSLYALYKIIPEDTSTIKTFILLLDSSNTHLQLFGLYIFSRAALYYNDNLVKRVCRLLVESCSCDVIMGALYTLRSLKVHFIGSPARDTDSSLEIQKPKEIRKDVINFLLDGLANLIHLPIHDTFYEALSCITSIDEHKKSESFSEATTSPKTDSSVLALSKSSAKSRTNKIAKDYRYLLEFLLVKDGLMSNYFSTFQSLNVNIDDLTNRLLLQLQEGTLEQMHRAINVYGVLIPCHEKYYLYSTERAIIERIQELNSITSRLDPDEYTSSGTTNASQLVVISAEDEDTPVTTDSNTSTSISTTLRQMSLRVVKPVPKVDTSASAANVTTLNYSVDIVRLCQSLHVLGRIAKTQNALLAILDVSYHHNHVVQIFVYEAYRRMVVRHPDLMTEGILHHLYEKFDLLHQQISTRIICEIYYLKYTLIDLNALRPHLLATGGSTKVDMLKRMNVFLLINKIAILFPYTLTDSILSYILLIVEENYTDSNGSLTLKIGFCTIQSIIQYCPQCLTQSIFVRFIHHLYSRSSSEEIKELCLDTLITVVSVYKELYVTADIFEKAVNKILSYDLRVSFESVKIILKSFVFLVQRYPKYLNEYTILVIYKKYSECEKEEQRETFHNLFDLILEKTRSSQLFINLIIQKRIDLIITKKILVELQTYVSSVHESNDFIDEQQEEQVTEIISNAFYISIGNHKNFFQLLKILFDTKNYSYFNPKMTDILVEKLEKALMGKGAEFEALDEGVNEMRSTESVNQSNRVSRRLSTMINLGGRSSSAAMTMTKNEEKQQPGRSNIITRNEVIALCSDCLAFLAKNLPDLFFKSHADKVISIFESISFSKNVIEILSNLESVKNFQGISNASSINFGMVLPFVCKVVDSLLQSRKEFISRAFIESLINRVEFFTESSEIKETISTLSTSSRSPNSSGKFNAVPSAPTRRLSSLFSREAQPATPPDMPSAVSSQNPNSETQQYNKAMRRELLQMISVASEVYPEFFASDSSAGSKEYPDGILNLLLYTNERSKYPLDGNARNQLSEVYTVFNITDATRFDIIHSIARRHHVNIYTPSTEWFLHSLFLHSDLSKKFVREAFYAVISTLAKNPTAMLTVELFEGILSRMGTAKVFDALSGVSPEEGLNAKKSCCFAMGLIVLHKPHFISDKLINTVTSILIFHERESYDLLKSVLYIVENLTLQRKSFMNHSIFNALCDIFDKYWQQCKAKESTKNQIGDGFEMLECILKILKVVTNQPSPVEMLFNVFSIPSSPMSIIDAKGILEKNRKHNRIILTCVYHLAVYNGYSKTLLNIQELSLVILSQLSQHNCDGLLQYIPLVEDSHREIVFSVQDTVSSLNENIHVQYEQRNRLAEALEIQRAYVQHSVLPHVFNENVTIRTLTMKIFKHLCNSYLLKLPFGDIVFYVMIMKLFDSNDGIISLARDILYLLVRSNDTYVLVITYCIHNRILHNINSHTIVSNNLIIQVLVYVIHNDYLHIFPQKVYSQVSKELFHIAVTKTYNCRTKTLMNSSPRKEVEKDGSGLIGRDSEITKSNTRLNSTHKSTTTPINFSRPDALKAHSDGQSPNIKRSSLMQGIEKLSQTTGIHLRKVEHNCDNISVLKTSGTNSDDTAQGSGVPESILPLRYSDLVIPEVYMSNLSHKYYVNSHTLVSQRHLYPLYLIESSARDILEKSGYYSSTYVMTLYLQLVAYEYSKNNLYRIKSLLVLLKYTTQQLMNGFEKVCNLQTQSETPRDISVQTNRKLIQILRDIYSKIDESFVTFLNSKEDILKDEIKKNIK